MGLSETRSVDPMGALMGRVSELAHPGATERELEDAVRVAARDLGMKVIKTGRVSGAPLELHDWSFDAREWLQREHGVVIGAQKGSA